MKKKLMQLMTAARTATQKKRPRSPESSPDKKAGQKKEKKKEDAHASEVPQVAVEVVPKTQPVNKGGLKVLAKVAEGQTFASVLPKIKTDFRPEVCNVTVLGSVKTAKGVVLLKLKKDSDTRRMAADLDEIVAGIGKVAESNESKVTVEIHDLDAFAKKGKVEDAVEKALGRRHEVTLLKPSKRQQTMAFVVLQESEAAKMEQLGHLRVGFISCRVRRRVNVKRCLRCLGFGHTAAGCKEENRSRLSFCCRSCNHRKKDCKEKPRCFLCKEDNKHESGSGSDCRLRRAKEKQQQSK